MNLPVVVREIHPSEVSSVEQMIFLSFESVRNIYRPSPISEANRPMPLGDKSRLIALYENKIVGTVRYVFDEDRLHLIGLATHPEYRQQGVASQLMDKLVEMGTQYNMRALSLSTIRETDNRKVFEKLGFKVLFEMPASDLISMQGELLHELYLERALYV